MALREERGLMQEFDVKGFPTVMVVVGKGGQQERRVSPEKRGLVSNQLGSKKEMSFLLLQEATSPRPSVLRANARHRRFSTSFCLMSASLQRRACRVRCGLVTKACTTRLLPAGV